MDVLLGLVLAGVTILAGRLLAGVTILAGRLLAFGDATHVGVAGTLLGGVIGFLAAWLIERSRLRHADAHGFEADKRAAHVRFLEAA